MFCSHFQDLKEAFTCTPTISCGADNEKGGGRELIAEAVIGK